MTASPEWSMVPGDALPPGRSVDRPGGRRGAPAGCAGLRCHHQLSPQAPAERAAGRRGRPARSDRHDPAGWAYQGPQQRARAHREQPPTALPRPHAARERGQGVQRRGGAPAGGRPEAQAGRHGWQPAARPPDRLARRHRPPAAQPHQRAARLHAVTGLRRPAGTRPRGLRLDRRDHLVGRPASAQLPSRCPVRILEHRQHRKPELPVAHQPERHRAAERLGQASPAARRCPAPSSTATASGRTGPTPT